MDEAVTIKLSSPEELAITANLYFEDMKQNRRHAFIRTVEKEGKYPSILTRPYPAGVVEDFQLIRMFMRFDRDARISDFSTFCGRSSS